jgi:GH24 family phage-related lysozyme (muramidase)
MLLPAQMRLPVLVAALATSIVLAGCGAGASSPGSRPSPPVARPASATVQSPPPGSAQPSEVRYPNGEVRVGAFVRPPGGTGPPLGLQFGGYERHITQPGLILIRREEGFESCPYEDVTGVWTIGIGEAYVSRSTPCESEATAYVKLRNQIADHYEWSVRAIGGNGFPQHIFNALVDFDYNEGPYIFEISPSLSYHLSHHEWGSAEQEMLGFDIAGGRYNGDLARRRENEVAMMRAYEPPEETAAQRRAREERELAGHEQLLAHLRLQVVHLRAKLAHYHCYPALKAHRAGPKCSGWKAAGNRVGAHGRREDAFVARLERALR